MWVHSSNPDVFFITETWLRRNVLNTDVDLSGYNLFSARQIYQRWGRGNLFQGSPSVFYCLHQVCPKHFYLLVLSIKLSYSSLLTVAGSNSDLCSDICFTDFCFRKSQGFLHANTRSLLPKMDQLKVWVHSFNPDVLVINDTWLRKSVLNTDVNLPDYNFFRHDRSSKGGGVAIFTMDHLQCLVVSTKSVPKQFDLQVLSIKLSNSSLLTVASVIVLHQHRPVPYLL